MQTPHANPHANPHARPHASPLVVVLQVPRGTSSMLFFNDLLSDIIYFLVLHVCVYFSTLACQEHNVISAILFTTININM